MDFIGILKTAQSIQREAKSNAPVRRYSTTLSAPKKLPKPAVNTEALKKYFEKKEQDERQELAKKLEDKTKLLELRSQDKKSNRRVMAMLKRTKAASKAVIEGVDDPAEAGLDTSTYQPDEDDYGYVSQTASEMHKKLLSKYNMTNLERTSSKPKNDGNLDAVKRRVNDSLNKEMEEEAVPGKRRRKKKSHDKPDPEPSPPVKSEKSEKPKRDKNVVVRPKVSQPTMNFEEILKLAQVKQFEPVKIENKKPVKEAEFERPMTAKEKEEYLREKERKLRRDGKLPPIPKVEPKTELPPIPKKESTKENISTVTKNIAPSGQKSKEQSEQTNKEKMAPPKPPTKDSKAGDQTLKAQVKPKEFPPRDMLPKQFPPKDLQPKQFPPKDLLPKQFPPKDLQPKQFPPRDIMSNKDLPRKRPMKSSDSSRAPMKRRQIESDEEYDSELDDFIDDEPIEEQSAISKEIQAIFGSRYKRYEPSDDDSDGCMEVGFGQVEKEEMRSLRAGIKEDLEDIERELDMKKRKKVQKRR